jgi:hypothetical protein
MIMTGESIHGVGQQMVDDHYKVDDLVSVIGVSIPGPGLHMVDDLVSVIGVSIPGAGQHG